jgi:hypothetical protein
MWKPFSGGRGMEGSPVVKELHERIFTMEEAVRLPFLDHNEARQSRWQFWRYYLSYAALREKRGRTTFYVVGLVSLASAITVPALVGLNLSGTGGVTVRWITFAFSLVTAFAAGILTLYRVGDRWLMYRRLLDSLMLAARTLVDHANSSDLVRQEAWDDFVGSTERAVTDYERAYETAVILAALHPGASRSGER